MPSSLAGVAGVPCLGWDVSEPGASLLAVLFPHLAALRVHRVEDCGDAVVIWASCRAGTACCPRCGQSSARVHGGYSRVVADGAAGGRPVLIVLAVRRFRCQNPACAAVTFAEQAAGVSVRYRRRSVPLLGMLAGFGLELAGRAAARLAGTLGIAVDPATVLRLVAAAPEPEVTAAPGVLGVDDFALAKGQVYGTVLVDMATGDVIDLLPDREAATFEAWLRAHPGAEVICRDRAGNYAEGARAGAPDAIQVADRWHLWHNLAGHAEKAVAAHRGCLTDPGPDPAGEPDDAAAASPDVPVRPAGPDGLRGADGRERRLVSRTRERHAAVHELLAAGHSLHSASRALGLDRKTVRRFARQPDPDTLLVKATSRPSILDPFKGYLGQRWNDGITNAAVLHEEIRARGWTGHLHAVERYLRQFRTADGRDRQARARPQHPAPTAPPPPKTRQITSWLLRRPETLSDDEQAQLAAICARCPHIDALAGHIRTFAEMMTGRTGENDLEGWLATAEAGDLPELRSFAHGIRTDQQAVTNGLTLPWSSGKVEGAVNKIKMLKRQMYGRASFDLLRKRVIMHPA
jgi:transposase